MLRPIHQVWGNPPTHTDQYLHWKSNHHITAKQSVYNTLAHRAKVVSSSQDRLDQELQHIKSALQACQFPNWALNQWHHRFLNNNQVNNNNPTNTTTNTNQDNNPTKRNITLVVPFIPGTSEKFKKLQGQWNTSTLQGHQHPQDTVRQSQGQRPQSQQNWYHIPIQMPTHKLPRSIHRGIRKGSRWQNQGTSQGTLPLPPTQCHNTTCIGSRTFQYCTQGG